MKNLLKYGYASTALVVLLTIVGVLTFGGCNKRPYSRIARLPLQINLDWSSVSQDAVVPEKLKLYLYAPDNSVSEYEIGKEGKTLELPLGTYRAICVNVNDYVEVLYRDKFETAQMIAKQVSSVASYQGNVSKADGTKAIYQPGWVFSYSMPEIKVGDASITNSQNTVSTVVFPMQKLIKVVNFRFNVTGLTSEITNVRGRLDNVASTVELATGKVVTGYQATCPFKLEYQSDGSLGGSMLIFGNEADVNTDLKNNLKLEFETESGRTITQESDITEQMTSGDVEGDINIKVEGDIDVKYDAGMITIVIDWKNGSSEDLDGI